MEPKFIPDYKCLMCEKNLIKNQVNFCSDDCKFEWYWNHINDDIKCKKCNNSISWVNPRYKDWCAACSYKQDLVNNPSHYNQWKIEVADFIADQKMDYFEGNCCKYLCRYKYKNWVEDLKKAQWYLNYLIKREEWKTK